MSAAVAAHQHAVRRMLQPAVDAGYLTENQLEQCVEHCDGSPWDAKDRTNPTTPNAINVDVVWETYDYDAFRLMDQGLNRRPDHVTRVIKSMAKQPLDDPIVVNGDYMIIDGQHRFLARRYLGLPIRYLIKNNYGVTEARNYNNSSKNWGKGDFVASYSAEGRTGYVELEQLYINFPKLPKAVIDTVATQGQAASRSSTMIQQGNLQSVSYEECEKICKLLMEYAHVPNFVSPEKMIISSAQWCNAWLTIYFRNLDTFDPDRMLRLARQTPSFVYPAGNIHATCEMLNKLYNRYKGGVQLKY